MLYKCRFLLPYNISRITSTHTCVVCAPILCRNIIEKKEMFTLLIKRSNLIYFECKLESTSNFWPCLMHAVFDKWLMGLWPWPRSRIHFLGEFGLRSGSLLTHFEFFFFGTKRCEFKKHFILRLWPFLVQKKSSDPDRSRIFFFCVCAVKTQTQWLIEDRIAKVNVMSFKKNVLYDATNTWYYNVMNVLG